MRLVRDHSKLLLLCSFPQVPEDLLATTLDLLAHQHARNLVIPLLERFEQSLFSGTRLCRDVGCQQLRIITLSIKDLSNRAVFVSDFRQQGIASRLDQQFMESLLGVQPRIDLSLCGVPLLLLLNLLGDSLCLVQNRIQFFQLMFGDVPCRLASSATFQCVSQNVKVVEIMRVGLANEGAGTGNVFDETLARKSMNRLADGNHAHSDFVRKSSIHEPFAGRKITPRHPLADVNVRFLCKGLFHVFRPWA